MARFSQKAMNNVVIFAMLFMIILFNIDKFVDKTPKQVDMPLLRPDAYVLKIEHANNALERVGTGWRIVTQTAPQETLEPLPQLAAWQRGILVPYQQFNESLDNAQAHVVVVWLAGQPVGDVFAFYLTSEYVAVKYADQWWKLTNVSLDELLPWLTSNADNN